MMKYCVVPRCPNLTEGSYCARHNRERRRPEYREDLQRRGSSSSRGYDKAWEALAKRVLIEEPFCRECGSQSEVADHFVPLRYGGSRLDRGNLQGLCRKCNTRKFYQDRERYRKSFRPHSREPGGGVGFDPVRVFCK